MKDGWIKVAAATPALKVADAVYNTQEIIELKVGKTTPQGYRDWNALAAAVRKAARKVAAYAREVDPVAKEG